MTGIPTPESGGVPSRMARLWSQLRFRDALMLSLIPLFAIALLFGASLLDYLHAREFDDWYSREQTLPLLFSSRAKAIVMLPRSLHLRDSFSPQAADAGIIRLEVPGQRWDSLEFEGPGIWAPWLDGQLRYGTTSMRVKLRKRGDNSVHWLTDKRSITIRTPKDSFYKSFHTFALSAKDVLTSYVANQLSHDFDLAATATSISPVFLNNRFYGTYRLIETVDETFLGPTDRAKGNIFRGDAAERGEYSKGVPRGLFVNPALWSLAAQSDQPTKASKVTKSIAGKPLQLPQLLTDVSGTTFEDHLRLMGRVDRDEFARLLAYLLLVGDPYHMDGIHNQVLYEDPSTHVLHPVPWDVRLLPLKHPEKPISPLFQAVLRDPFVADSIMRIVAQRLEGDRFLKRTDSLLAAVQARYGQYLQYDQLRTGLIPDVGNADDARAVLRDNATLLRRWMASDQIAFAAAPVSGGATLLDFETRGYVGGDVTGFTLDRAPTGPVSIRLDANLDGLAGAGEPTVAVKAGASGATSLQLAQPVTLYPAWETSEAAIRPGHMPYRLIVTGLAAGTHVVPIVKNRATGVAASVVAWQAGALVREGTAWHPWRFPAPSHQVQRIGGGVRIAQTLRIAEGDSLVIAPGSVLRMAPGASILSRGVIIARGTPAQPIRIVADDAEQPWGALAMQGKGADSSVFTNVEMSGGGGARLEDVDYVGMANVHRANGTVWDHVHLHDDRRGTALLHVLESRAHITDSRFTNARYNGIAFDAASGEIVNSAFDSAGNAGLHLMASAPFVVGNRISRSRSKGVSIGDAGRPFLFNNAVDSSAVGIEVKDGAAPVLLNTLLSRNGVGLDERQKGTQYGAGGWATVALTAFDHNKTTQTRDGYSRVTLGNVTGFDSSGVAGVTEAADVAWLYRQRGIVPPGGKVTPGLLAAWTAAAPEQPLDQQSFHDDLASVSDGWRATGGITHLEKRHDALSADVQLRRGTISRPVSWTLSRAATLVLELSASDVSAARVIISGPSGASVSVPFDAGSDITTGHFITVPVPAGTYDRLAIELEPVPGRTEVDAKGFTVLRGGRLELRRLLLWPQYVSAPTPTGASR